MSSLMIILLIVVALLTAMFIYGYLKMRKVEGVKDSKNVIHLTDKNFKSQLKRGDIIVDFWAPWCMPCKMLVPIMNEIADEYQQSIRVGKLNVEAARNVAAKYGIKNIPTVIVFREGKEYKRFVGVKAKSVYLKAVGLK